LHTVTTTDSTVVWREILKDHIAHACLKNIIEITIDGSPNLTRIDDDFCSRTPAVEAVCIRNAAFDDNRRQLLPCVPFP
jgi:hypothetical protein